MYAIFQSGGKQYKAQPGTVVKLEKIPGEVGDRVSLDQVLFFQDGEEVRIGQPLLDDVNVQGRIVEQGRHRKIIVFKFKRRKDYRKKMGHRQSYTAVLIESVGGRGGEVRLDKRAEEPPEAVQAPEAMAPEASSTETADMDKE